MKRQPRTPKTSAYQQARQERIARVREAVRQGVTVSEIARIAGMKRSTVHRVMSELGLECGGVRLQQDRDRQIYRDWLGGESYLRLAARYGLAKSNIHRIVTREKSLEAA